MEVQETGLAGCFIIKPRVFEDERGYFFESFNAQTFRDVTGFEGAFVQDNQSYSSYGVIRGLHAQSGEFAQAKLIRVLKGEVLDVAVDTRRNSLTYGKHVAVVLSEANKLQLLVPKGFLHGFAVFSEQAEVFYKCDNFYQKSAEYGVQFNDLALGIDWKIPASAAIVSDKDLVLPAFADITTEPIK